MQQSDLLSVLARSVEIIDHVMTHLLLGLRFIEFRTLLSNYVKPIRSRRLPSLLSLVSQIWKVTHPAGAHVHSHRKVGYPIAYEQIYAYIQDETSLFMTTSIHDADVTSVCR